MSQLERQPGRRREAPITDEDMDRVFAAVTSERPPALSAHEIRVPADEVVELEDINELSSALRTASSRPPRSAPPRARANTLLGMAPPGSSARVPATPLAFSAPSVAPPPEPPTLLPTPGPELAAALSVGPTTTSPPAPTPSLSRALAARARLFGREAPLWTIAALASLPLAALSAALGAAASAGDAPATPAPAVTSAGAALSASMPAPAPSASAAAASACPTAPAAAKLAAAGGRGMTDVLERAQARLARETAHAKQFADVLAREPDVLQQPAVLAELRQHLSRAHAAPEALRALATVPGPLGADLLYEVWTSAKKRTDTSELARELLLSPEVRAKASPALAVALDLGDAVECEQQRSLLLLAASDGDRRLMPLLGKLAYPRGCGPDKRQDCYRCLRQGDELRAAVNGVKNRRAPKRLPAF